MSRDGFAFRVDLGNNCGRHPIISEFYKLRRNAIKDIASYLGFLVGFIGSAPFAWGLLAVQLDAGRFARGLWYFFGIVTTAGIFSGIAGMGIGIAAGLLWEQVHRHRRTSRGGAVATESRDNGRRPDDVIEGEPRLQLISPTPVPLPGVEGKTITSIRFTRDAVELDFGSERMGTAGNIVVVTATARLTSGEPAWRDALCSVIGSRVERVRAAPGERFEVLFDNGIAVLMPRSTESISGNRSRKLNES